MDIHETAWSNWSPELPDELQPDNRFGWFNESQTTAPSTSTHFVVTKYGNRYKYFEVEWNSHDDRRRWREIDCEECRIRSSHCAQDQPSWYSTFPGYLGLIVNPEKRTVARVGCREVVTLPQMEFNLFHLVYKAGGNRTSKAAVENQHKLQEGSPNAIRQRKKMLNDNLIPLSLEIDRSWRLIDDGKTTSEVLET